MKANKALPLFIFFCLVGCEMPGPYRDIEISIAGTDYAKISLYSLPTYNLVTHQAWDYNYEQNVHISNIPDGEYYLKVDGGSRFQSAIEIKDTTFVYKGRFNLYLAF